MSKKESINFEYVIEKAVENQLILNNKMKNKNWRESNVPFYRACWFESAEKLEHINWEWWKQRNTNMSQVYLESADILHFLISATYMKYYKELKDDTLAVKKTVVELNDSLQMSQATKLQISVDVDVELYCQSIEKYIAAVLSAQNGCPKVFFDMCRVLGLSFDNLFKLYFAKSVLNNFRQDHGDKEGTYDRKWHSQGTDSIQSDNELLYELSVSTKMNDKFKNHLYEHLEKAYDKHQEFKRKKAKKA